MVVLKVTVVDGVIGILVELSPLQVIEWAKNTQDLVLTEVRVGPVKEWTFKAVELTDGAIRTQCCSA